MNKRDEELIEEAIANLQLRYRSSRHTVAAAARMKNGTMLTAINSQHFSGFVCAEMALLDMAINKGNPNIDTIVSVHFKENTKDIRIVNPCGKCRQLILEYSPATKMIISSDEKQLKLPVTELLPFSYVQTQTKRIWDEN